MGPIRTGRGWTLGLGVENQSIQLKLFQYPQRLTVNFFSTGNGKMQTNVQKHTENHSITRKCHSNALGLLRSQRLRLDSYRELAKYNALVLPKHYKQHNISFFSTFAVFPTVYYNFFSISSVDVNWKYSLTTKYKLSTAYPQVLRLTKCY